MKKLLISFAVIGCFLFGIFIPQQFVQGRFSIIDDVNSHHIEDSCPPIQNTPFFTIAYGTVSLNGVSAPVGSLVKAFSPRGDMVGCFAVTSSGNYGTMYIYGEDNSVNPPIPGMRANEEVAFSIEGVPAEAAPILLWSNDKDLHQINLSSMGVSADFSATPTSGVFPLNVQFTDNSSGSITSWLWNFGDGQTSTITNPLHTYNTPGFYTVSLTVSGDAGTDTESKSNYISVYTAVNANFSANLTSGIAPLSITFTNSSTGDYTNSSWSFGDGGTSTATNPTHIFANGGIYTIGLTVTGPGGIDTETKLNYITVYSPVVANFTANPASGIAPLTVNFTNTSSGDYSSFNWEFGDGSTSTAVNPSHVYSSSGVYTVTLTASGLGGTDQQSSYIYVYEPVNANFSGAPMSGIAPLNVSFTNLSSGDFSSSLWDFGDGSTSSETNPTHHYLTGGIYDVSLTVSGLGGTDNETRQAYVTIYNPSEAQFEGTPSSGVFPLVVNFSNLSSGDYDVLSWNFGDGEISSLENPEHIYTAEGTYSVSLTLNGPGGTDVETKTNYIQVYTAIDANFSAVPTSGTAPLFVSFTNESTGSYDYLSWDFGDGTTSGELNPTHTYINPGIYTVTLTATGPGGISIETKNDYVTVFEEVVSDFSADPLSGIAPVSIGFTNLSSGDFNALFWDFGDGSTSTENNPIHEYTQAGVFTVSLTASGPGGSDMESKTGYVTVYQAVVADFSAVPLSGISPLSVNFTNLSSGDFSSLLWDFGDGSTSIETNPSHIFQNPGTYTVSLTASGPGGSDIETKSDYITVYQTVATDFSAVPLSGIAPLSVNFTNLSSGDYSNLLWDFGDGSTSTLNNPLHEFLLPGIYTVSLTASGPGGSDTETKVGYITVYSPVVADFSGSPLEGIAPLDVTFTNLSSGDYSSLTWQFGDGQSSDIANPTHSYTDPGIYSVSLTVTGLGGTDIEVKNDYIIVYEPVIADFTFMPSSGPAPLSVNFTNSSSGDYESFTWDFGDGETSNLENPVHVYQTPGCYTVSLTVSGNGGTDTEIKTDIIMVYEPAVANFYSNVTEGIAPLTVQFTDTSTGDIDTWMWDFGDGITSTEQNPSHQYLTGDTYTVTMTVSGLGGSDMHQSDIIVYTQVEAFFIADPSYGYIPLTVHFTDQSTGDYTILAWDFGDGSPISNETNPIHTFTEIGVFTVILTATGPGGEDSYQLEVTVIPYKIFLPIIIR